MKKTLIVLSVLALAGCGTFKKDKEAKVDDKASGTAAKSAPAPAPAPVRVVAPSPNVQRKMVNNFNNKGIRLEWDCEISGTDNTCQKGEPKAIEASGTAYIYGNTENAKQTAFRAAELRALARLRQFIHQDVFSTNTVNTLTKTIERVNQSGKDTNTDEISMSDDEAKSSQSVINNENSSRIVTVVTETIRTNASGILRGVYLTDAQLSEGRTVSVTIRWDRGSENISNYLFNQFSN